MIVLLFQKVIIIIISIPSFLPSFSLSLFLVSISKLINSNLIRKTRVISTTQNNSKLLQNSISLAPTTTNLNHQTFSSCKFPKWFNKRWVKIPPFSPSSSLSIHFRWSSIKQNKILTLDHKLNNLIYYDEKKSTIIEKHECIQVKSRKQSNYQIIIKSLNEW